MNELSKDAVQWLTIGDESAGQRVDNYLTRLLKGVPKSHIYRILRSGEVRVNKGRVGPDARLALGDVVRIPPVRTAAPAFPGEPAPHHVRAGAALPILYEDDALIVIDKPSGLAVHGGSGIAAGLIEQLRAARPQAKFLELVHRLDRDTSGVMLVAKKRAALVDLHAQLRDHGFDKRYQVLVRGRWRDAMRRVKLGLHKFSTADGERRVRVDDDEGQESETIFRRQATWFEREPPLALLEAELKTGRTHQIRVHLTHLGFPLAGDDKYGDFAWNKELARSGLKRMFLHAQTLAFDHPVTRERMSFVAPLPPELARFIARLDAAPAPKPMRDPGARRFRLLVFDWDGTLSDSTTMIAHAIQAACGDVGEPVPDLDAARFVIGLGLADALRRVAPGLPAPRYPELSARFRHHYLGGEDDIPLFDGAFDLLHELDAAGYLLAVATGKNRAGLARALAKHGLDTRFHATRCADEGMPKPHPDMLLHLMDRLAVDAGETLMIGDTTHDLELARNAKTAALAVAYGAHEAAGLAALQPEATAHSIAEMRAWLATNG